MPAPVPAWMFETCQLVAGKYALPRSHSVATSSASAGAALVDRIAGEVRIGDVALHALDAQLARQRAAAPVLDHVAERAHGGRLADDAVVELPALRGEPVAERHGAVERRAFLVARDQEGDRAGRIGPGGDELLDRDHHRGERALHVGSAAAVQHAVAVRRHERVAGPLVERAGRHDVGVAGEREDLRRRPPAGPERPQVGDAAVGGSARSLLAIEAERRQAGRDQVLAAAVGRRDRTAGDQLLGEVQGSRHGLATALRSAAGSPTSCCGSSGRTSIVISVKLGWSSVSSFFAGARGERRGVVLQPPHQVGRRVGEGEAFVARDPTVGDHAGEVFLERLRAFGERLLHRFLDAGEVARGDQLGDQLGVQHHLDRRQAAARARPAPGAARRSRAGRHRGRRAARAALPACRTTGSGRAPGSCCWRAASTARGGPTASTRSRRSSSRGRGSRRSGCSRAPGAARCAAPTCRLCVSRPTSRWLTTDFLLLNRNSIGSSIVRMCPAICLLRCSSIDASVVLLPVPVAPTIRIRPRFSSTIVLRISGTLRLSSVGMSNGMQRNTAAIVPRCLKPDRRKLPTPEMLTPRFSSPVSSSSSSWLGVSSSASSWRGCVLVSGCFAELQQLAVDLDQDRRAGGQVDVGRPLLRHQSEHPLHVACAHARSRSRECRRLCNGAFLRMDPKQ